MEVVLFLVVIAAAIGLVFFYKRELPATIIKLDQTPSEPPAPPAPVADVMPAEPVSVNLTPDTVKLAEEVKAEPAPAPAKKQAAKKTAAKKPAGAAKKKK